jgi:hypothetical protein
VRPARRCVLSLVPSPPLPGEGFGKVRFLHTRAAMTPVLLGSSHSANVQLALAGLYTSLSFCFLDRELPISDFHNFCQKLSSVIMIAIPAPLWNPRSVALELRRLPLQVCHLRAGKPCSQQACERDSHDKKGASNCSSAD